MRNNTLASLPISSHVCKYSHISPFTSYFMCIHVCVYKQFLLLMQEHGYAPGCVSGWCAILPARHIPTLHLKHTSRGRKWRQWAQWRGGARDRAGAEASSQLNYCASSQFGAGWNSPRSKRGLACNLWQWKEWNRTERDVLSWELACCQGRVLRPMVTTRLCTATARLYIEQPLPERHWLKQI